MTLWGPLFHSGGEGEIRTRGELPHDGFQDRYLKPLGHLSIMLPTDYTKLPLIFLGVGVQLLLPIPRARLLQAAAAMHSEPWHQLCTRHRSTRKSDF